MHSRLIHKLSRRVIAERLEVASSLFARMRGLLGRKELPAGHAMLIERCSSIHTFFLRFPIDVIFVDGHFDVMKTLADLPPWRLAGAWGARHVIELPAGALREIDLAPGERLLLEGAA